ALSAEPEPPPPLTSTSESGTTSPGAPMYATGEPARTVAPPWRRTLSSVPAATDSTSTWALSVWTLNSDSPSATVSPTFFNHSTITNSSVVCPTDGMSIRCTTVLAQPSQQRRIAALIRACEGTTVCSITGATGSGTSWLATLRMGACSEYRHSSATLAASSAPHPPVSVSSWAITRRPVFLTDAKIVSSSNGSSVSGSITSQSMPSWASSSAAARERYKLMCVATTVTVVPARFTTALPMGKKYSSSGTCAVRSMPPACSRPLLP